MRFDLLVIKRVNDMTKPTYKCSIIADPKGQAWGFACKVHDYIKKKIEKNKREKKQAYADFIVEGLKAKFPDDSSEERLKFASLIYDGIHKEQEDVLELNPLEITNFKDGEHKSKILNNIRGSNCFFIHDSNSHPDRWFSGMCTVNEALGSSSAHEIINVFPYLKFSRQDRKDESRVSTNTKAVAHPLNRTHTRVLTLDVHSDAVQGPYDIPFDPLYSSPTVTAYLKKNHPQLLEDLTVVSPDVGGGPRAEAYAKRLGIEEVVIGYKTRGSPGRVEGVRFPSDIDFQNKNILIIDDIIDSGGTLIRAADILRERKAKGIYAYATHGLFTDGYKKVTKHFDRVFVGDTLKQPDVTKLEVISFTDLFGEAIYRINESESLSELFD